MKPQNANRTGWSGRLTRGRWARVSEALLVAAAVVALACIPACPARAVTATLQVDEFNGLDGYADLHCLVNLTDSNSAWESVEFHVSLIGQWTASSGSLWVGQGGAGDHIFPTGAMTYYEFAWDPPNQTGTFDLWAVAHGYTNNPYPNPATWWDASTGDNYYDYL